MSTVSPGLQGAAGMEKVNFTAFLQFQKVFTTSTVLVVALLLNLVNTLSFLARKVEDKNNVIIIRRKNKEKCILRLDRFLFE